MELIFRPGFSTRERADGLAGRGVGMDVVRDAILGLRGRVTAVVSSHNLAELQAICDHATVLDRGGQPDEKCGELLVARPAAESPAKMPGGAVEDAHGPCQSRLPERESREEGDSSMRSKRPGRTARPASMARAARALSRLPRSAWDRTGAMSRPGSAALSRARASLRPGRGALFAG